MNGRRSRLTVRLAAGGIGFGIAVVGILAVLLEPERLARGEAFRDDLGLLAGAGAMFLLGALSAGLLRRSPPGERPATHRATLPFRTTGGDEVDTGASQLTGSTLDPIEQQLRRARDVSNTIAHDLRTPLAELRARLEEVLVTRPATEQILAEIDSAVADVDRVIGIFNALLRLAEIEAGIRRSDFVEVDLERVVSDMCDFYQPVAELKDLRLTCSPLKLPTVKGDPLLLAQALGNLIDNALKFTQQGGSVTVTAGRQRSGRVYLAVADDGPGISEADMPYVIRRFYRGDASRATPGVGLGLSLVDAIAKLHGGTLELTDNRPGLRATIVVGSDAVNPAVAGYRRDQEPMREVVLASRNRKKLEEMQALLAPLNWQLRLVSDFSDEAPAETAATFIENALIKARHAARVSGLAAIADDSGIEVDALRGRPGVRSARYAGDDATDADNNARLLSDLAGTSTEARGARFVCVMAYLRHADDPIPVIAQGLWRGHILDTTKGNNGFGYDPLFWVPDLGCSAAELDPPVKNRISHRAQAAAALLAQLRET